MKLGTSSEPAPPRRQGRPRPGRHALRARSWNTRRPGCSSPTARATPSNARPTIDTLRRLMHEAVPIFGICLGNQLLALAAGADTYKLKFGHRAPEPALPRGGDASAATSPARTTASPSMPRTLPKGWQPWFTNANDGTNEGIRHACQAVHERPVPSRGLRRARPIRSSCSTTSARDC